MQTNKELEIRLNLTIREYARLTRALRYYQDNVGEVEALEVEHLRTSLSEGTIG